MMTAKEALEALAEMGRQLIEVKYTVGFSPNDAVGDLWEAVDIAGLIVKLDLLHPEADRAISEELEG